MQRAHVLAAAATAALLAAAWLSPHAIPYNMDEFVHYHALACATAPQQQGLPLFRDGCGLYDLRPPLATSAWPLRSYLYIGSVPALPFYPFLLLFDDPVAARVQGAVFALLCLLLAVRLLRVRAWSVAGAAVLLPVLLVTFVVDEGPVGLSAVLLLAALAALRRAIASDVPRRSLGWAAAAGLLVFLGFWVKLIFAWWLPAVAVFGWWEAFASAAGRRLPHGRRVAALVVAAVCCAAPLGLLLASSDREGRPYLQTALYRGRVEGGAESVERGATRLWSYAADASRVAPRNLVLPSSPIDALPGLVALGLVVAGLRGPRRREVASWTALALLTFGIASSNPYSQWTHHFFFPLLLLVLALAVAFDALSPQARTGVVLAAALFWGSLAVRWPSASFPLDSAPAKDALLRVLRERGRDRDSFEVHSSWGTYYIAQLFGDRQRIVVYLKAISDDRKLLAQARQLATERGRPLVLISSRRWERLQTPAVAEILGPPSRTWRFGDWWAVEYATSD